VNRDPNLEIWAIRLPLQLKPKYLDKMAFPLSQSSSTGGPIARISAGKKQTQYDITLASNSTGAEEMKGMTCLLPRRTKSGKLLICQYLFPVRTMIDTYPISAQKPFAGHLLLSESPAAPVASTSIQGDLPTTTSPAMPFPSSRRFSHPPHLLKHRYTPTSARRPNKGTIVADSGTAVREDSQRKQSATFMELDGTVSHPSSPTKSHKKRKMGEKEPEGEKDKKGKKRRTQLDN
jgi:DNA-directed RNA polymerase I subunit RPA34.5